MRILIDHHEPFLLAHGGLQIQIEQTHDALLRLGHDVENLKWWDNSQKAQVVHFFGLPPLHYVERAQGKGIRVVITHLLTDTCNRSKPHLFLQSLVTRFLLGFPPAGGYCSRMGWLSLRQADAVIVGLKIEKEIMESVWGVSPARLHRVPLGIHEAFVKNPLQNTLHLCKSKVPETEFLITVGTIAQRKYSLEIAKLAIEAQVPVLFVGQPLSEKEAYWKSFKQLSETDFVWHISHTDDPQELASYYRAAKGFVHFSDGENWCLAAHEAAACGLPLLLRDQPWSRERFGTASRYWSNDEIAAHDLLRFFKEASMKSSDFLPVTWQDSAIHLAGLYESLVKTPN